ncbi:MAG: TonB-dependent receptor domain-containing protein, partial [Acidimicrobiales bacterium]
LQLSDRVRLEIGLRADLFRFGLADRLLGTRQAEWEGIVSPKANLAVRVGAATTVFANAAAGFHSNDARDVVAAGTGVTTLPRATGMELGLRHSWTRGSLAASVWGLDLESELVYVGDEGVTEPSGRTRRVGIDLEARLRLAPWLWADADVNLARGRFRDEPGGADYIPLAPTITSIGGLTVRDWGPWVGGLRYRVVGSRPADETGSITALGSAVWEVFATYRFARFDVVLTVDNLFAASWNEAQFATTSRLGAEPGPVTELHFTPGAPRSVQLGIAVRP